MTVNELVKELLLLQKQGKGQYTIVPFVFNFEYGHVSGEDKSWINGVDDEYKQVYIGGE